MRKIKITLMKIISFLTATILLTNIVAVGQRTLTKEEIIADWKTSNELKHIQKDSIVVAGNSKVNILVHHILDSLQNEKIDSVIVYSIAYPGYSGKLSCISGYYPIETYIIWKSNNETNFEKLEGECRFQKIKVKSTALFDFYKTNKLVIENDFFMPIIYGGQIIDSNKTRISVSFTNHEPKYSLYYTIGQSYKIFDLTESDLTDKKSLFHFDNLGLATYRWWKLIAKQVGE